MLAGSTLAGTWTADLTASASLTIISSMTGSWTGDFDTNTPTLNLTLTISGSWTVDFTGAGALAIIDPMTGTFSFSLDGDADLKGRLRIEGEWSTSDTQQTVNYEGAIYCAVFGTDGTSYPAGTATSPVQTIASATYLANKYNIRHIFINGSHTLTEDYDYFTFTGWGSLVASTLTLSSGSALSYCTFENLGITGTMDDIHPVSPPHLFMLGTTQFKSCYIRALNDACGNYIDCQFTEAINLQPGKMLSAQNAVIEGDSTVFDLGNDAATVLSMDIASGWVQVDNMVTGSLAEFNFKGGEISFLGGCTGGEYYLEGVGTLFDESNGGLGGALTKKENHFIWDEIIEGSESGAGMLRITAAVAAGNASNLDGNASFQSMSGSKTRVAGTRSGGTRTITTRDGSP
jgi:hypothetical protein